MEAGAGLSFPPRVHEPPTSDKDLVASFDAQARTARQEVSPQVLLKFEEAVHRLCSVSYIARPRQEVAEAMAQGLEMVENTVFAPPHLRPAPCTYEDRMVDFNLQVPMSKMLSLSTEPELKMWEMVLANFNTACNIKGPYVKFLGPRFVKIRDPIERVLKQLGESKLQSFQLSDIANPSFLWLIDVLKEPSVEESFRVVDGHVEALVKEATEVGLQIVQSTASGDMEVAHHKQLEQVDLLERAQAQLASKYAMLGQNRAFFRDKYRELEGVLRKAIFELDRLQAANAAATKKQEEDLEALNDEMRVRLGKATKAAAEYERWIGSWTEQLAENKNRADDVWARMGELEVELQTIASERLELVKERIKRDNEEAVRRVEHQATEDFYRKHRQVLRANTLSCDILEKCCDTTYTILRNLNDEVVTFLDSISDELDKTMHDIDTRYDEIFRDMYSALGDTAFKRERLLATYRAQRTEAEMKRELLADQLHAESKRYYEVVADLDHRIPELEDEVANLKSRAKAALEKYYDVAGKRLSKLPGFEDPHEVLLRLQLEKRAKLVELAASECDTHQLQLAESRAVGDGTT
eukprot:Sspe_Gene.71287::Locus_42221_Transcript_1_1_Confidence_1.000_Length_1855::g.71287::m.71287